MTENQYDLELLSTDPGALIEKYQYMVATIVGIYVHIGYIVYQERDEMIQYINCRLLEKTGRIREQYNGSSKLKTYFSAIIRNICLEKLRSDRRYRVEEKVEHYTHNASYPETQYNDILIRQETERFRAVLELFPKQKQKLILFMKILFHLPVCIQDFLDFYPEVDIETAESIIREVSRPGFIPEKSVYVLMSPLVNARDKKDNTPDAIRKWFKSRMYEIIRLMNGNPRRANHTAETIQILAEYFFMELHKVFPEKKKENVYTT